jgi:16S rRNA (guanine527-N7)-methyltransferase
MNDIKHSESVLYTLSDLLAAANLPPLGSAQIAYFEVYLSLILRWNTRINLTAIRDPQSILQRHFVESIACARALPNGIGCLLDFGSGAGIPGIPIAICRPEIAVTLAESQGKKAAFLQQAARALKLPMGIQVHAGRAESLAAQFDCVTLRAVDHMEEAVHASTQLVRSGGWLAPMTTAKELERIQLAAGPAFRWSDPILLPGSDQRVLALASRMFHVAQFSN